MTDEQSVVYTRGLLLQAEIRMQAMFAENMQRFITGASMAYNEQSFLALIDEFMIHHNGLMRNLTNDRS